jgi:hypothetical protein
MHKYCTKKNLNILINPISSLGSTAVFLIKGTFSKKQTKTFCMLSLAALYCFKTNILNFKNVIYFEQCKADGESRLPVGEGHGGDHQAGHQHNHQHLLAL